MDYLALDSDGNVWILGGYTEEYEGGEYTNTESAWLGSAEGQMVGILAPAEVTTDTPRLVHRRSPRRGRLGRRAGRGRGPGVRGVRLLRRRPHRPGGRGRRPRQREQVLRARGRRDQQRAARRQPAQGPVRAAELRRAQPRGVWPRPAGPCWTSRRTPAGTPPPTCTAPPRSRSARRHERRPIVRLIGVSKSFAGRDRRRRPGARRRRPRAVAGREGQPRRAVGQREVDAAVLDRRAAATRLAARWRSTESRWPTGASGERAEVCAPSGSASPSSPTT